VDLARLHLSEGGIASGLCLPAIAAELEAVNLYPDPNCEALISALARHWGVPPQHLAAGNGSDELLLLCALALGDQSLPGTISAGTFPGHRFALEVSRRGFREVPLVDGRIDATAFAEAIPGAGIAFLCTPHNPSGTALTQPELDLIVAAASAAEVPLVTDEAYMEFAPQGTASAVGLAASGLRTVALRTFSKAYGLAGLRVGYAVGSRAEIAAIRAAQRVLPFRVNRLGQVAALAALEDSGCIERVRAETARRRRWFTAALREEGFEVRESATNFVAVAVADPAALASTLRADYGIAVRDTEDMGYPGHVRISLGEKNELERALRALVDCRPGAAAANR
jgi:histidinol-phosphate aminotransferase